MLIIQLLVYRLLFCSLFASPWTSGRNGHDIRALHAEISVLPEICRPEDIHL